MNFIICAWSKFLSNVDFCPIVSKSRPLCDARPSISIRYKPTRDNDGIKRSWSVVPSLRCFNAPARPLHPRDIRLSRSYFARYDVRPVSKLKDHLRSNGTGGIDWLTRLGQDADRVGRDIVLQRCRGYGFAVPTINREAIIIVSDGRFLLLSLLQITKFHR